MLNAKIKFYIQKKAIGKLKAQQKFTVLPKNLKNTI